MVEARKHSATASLTSVTDRSRTAMPCTPRSARQPASALAALAVLPYMLPYRMTTLLSSGCQRLHRSYLPRNQARSCRQMGPCSGAMTWMGMPAAFFSTACTWVPYLPTMLA